MEGHSNSLPAGMCGQRDMGRKNIAEFSRALQGKCSLETPGAALPSMEQGRGDPAPRLRIPGVPSCGSSPGKVLCQHELSRGILFQTFHCSPDNVIFLIFAH